MVANAEELLTADDPLLAEMFGATLLAVGELATAGLGAALAENLAAPLEKIGTPAAVAALLAVHAVQGDGTAGDAAERLMGRSAVPAPVWRDELFAPLTVLSCRRFADPEGTGSMLVVVFERAGRSHGFVIHVDHTDCDAAADIMTFPGEQLDEVVVSIEASSEGVSLPLTCEYLDPDEFRWQVERALNARAVHDRDDNLLGSDDSDDETAGYLVLAILLRARMRSLPDPPRPPAAHSDGNQPRLPDDLADALQLLQQVQQRVPAGSRRRLQAGPQLPARRKKSDGPAPVYQIKVGLRGAKLPIWRRLELPADIGLADLHQVIQLAFDWDDSHMHVFETPYGEFGVADQELGHRAEGRVTLEQVAPAAGARLTYVYDFGDDWAHEIVVEKVLSREPVAYPRCTGGRRAAPRDDCGGIWGYTELLDIIGDPAHPEHAERLEWLGLSSAADFDQARFDAADLTQVLQQRTLRSLSTS